MFPTLVCFWYTNLTSVGGSCYCSRDERERKEKTISHYWTQAEQNLQERQLDYTSAWTWDRDHKTSLKPVSIEFFFFRWSSCEIGQKHTDEVRIKYWLSSEQTTRTHTKLGGHATQGERRKVVVFGALLASRIRWISQGACISPARLSLDETRDHSQGACMGLLAVYNTQGSWRTWELFILMFWE